MRFRFVATLTIVLVARSTDAEAQAPTADDPGTCSFATPQYCGTVVSVSPIRAGDVRAFVNGRGDVIILGDRFGNGITVAPTGVVEGELRVSGEPGTTVNGGAEAILVTSGRLWISLKGGRDRIRVDGALPGDLAIRMGDDDDLVILGCPVVKGAVTIDTGPGNDAVDVQDSLLEESLVLRTGSGHDRMTSFFLSVRGQATIETGSGDDLLELGQTVIGDTLRVDTGAGADEFSLVGSFVLIQVVAVLIVRTGAGDDFVSIGQASVAGSLDVALGAQEDQLAVFCSDVGGPAHFSGGSGVDAVLGLPLNLFAGGPPMVRGFEMRGDLLIGCLLAQ